MQFACPVYSGLGDGFTDRGTQKIEDMIDAAFGVQVMDLALAEIRKKLPAEAGAVHWRHWQWERATEQIIQRRRKFGPIVVCIVGMSYGCDASAKTARTLAAEGIDVEYMGMIDPTALPYRAPPMMLPATVTKVDEFWSMRGFFNFPLAARKRDPSGKSGGKMMYAANAPKPEIFPINTGHIGTASDQFVQRRITNEVSKVLNTID